MLTTTCLTHIRSASQCLRQQSKRHIASSSILYQKVNDPVQQLFVNKIREYDSKKKAAGGKLVDLSAQDAKSYQDQMDRLSKQYKAEGQNMTEFPKFAFQDIAVNIKPVDTRDSETDLPL